MPPKKRRPRGEPEPGPSSAETAVNEELQSTNEELQSLNVNSQLAAKVEELEAKHNDLANLINSTDIATICLDTRFCIKWFTPATTQLMRLVPADTGRPFSDFAHKFVMEDLLHDAEAVLQKLAPLECEVQTSDGRWYLRRVLPYRTEDNRIDGTVVTFIDVTERKRADLQHHLALRRLEESEARVRAIVENTVDGIITIDEHGSIESVNPAAERLFGYSAAELINQNIKTLMPEPYRSGHDDYLRNYLRTGQKKIIGIGREVEGRRKDGSTFPMELSVSEVRFSDRRIFTGVVRDITERVRADHDRRQVEQELTSLNDRLELQVADRVELLHIVRDITIAANEAKTVEQAMQTALKRLCDYQRWQFGHVFLRADDGHLASSGIWHGSPSKRWERFQEITAQVRFAPGEGNIGRVFATGQPQWIEDIRQYPDWRRGDRNEVPARAVIAFPVTVENEIVAVLEFFGDQAMPPAARFMEIMTAVGIQLGHVIARKRLERAIADANVAQQRRVGQELHDSLSQQLTGMAMIADTLRHDLADESSSHAEQAARLSKYVNDAQKQVRLISRGLMPVELESRGLMTALEELADRCRELYGIACTCEWKSPVSLADNNKATHLYYIAQEAVHNAVKHSGAKRIVIRLERANGGISLQVRDDGCGMNVAEPRSGMGLSIMRYRADVISATLDVTSNPGKGTTVVCSLR